MIIWKPFPSFLLQVADYLNAYPSDVLAIFDKVLSRTALKFSEKAFPKQSNHDMKCFPHTRITGERIIIILFSHQLSNTVGLVRISLPKSSKLSKDVQR